MTRFTKRFKLELQAPVGMVSGDDYTVLKRLLCLTLTNVRQNT